MPGPQELLVIAVVALLVFGPDRLPEVARNAAKLLNRLRSETDRSVSEFKKAAQLEGLDAEWRGVADDLRETREQLRSPWRDPRRPSSDTSSGGQQLDAEGAWRAEDDPPPVDLEAT